MELSRSQRNWDELGKGDPLWVVLTRPEKKGGKWDPSEFFATGTKEVDDVLHEIDALGKSITFGKALDFGCGVGRLTQALAAHFNEVHGVDISPSMIGHANEFKFGNSNCTFHLNSQSNLQLFPSDYFDFIYSNIALQHIEPKYSLQYIEEFVRVLKPGGTGAFQVRTAKILRLLFPEFVAGWYREFKFKGEASIGMFGVPEKRVTNAVRKAGGEVVHIKRVEFDELSVRWRWVDLHFVITK